MSNAAEQQSTARQYFQYPGRYEMWRGGELDSPVIAYETWGELNAARDNAIVIFTGLSPSAHAASSEQDLAPGTVDGETTVRDRQSIGLHPSAHIIITVGEKALRIDTVFGESRTQ